MFIFCEHTIFVNINQGENVPPSHQTPIFPGKISIPTLSQLTHPQYPQCRIRETQMLLQTQATAFRLRDGIINFPGSLP